MNPSAKMSVCLYSDANFLAVNILENLLSKNCLVNVVTKHTRFDYAIFCGGFIDRKSVYSELAQFLSLPNLLRVKTLVLLPFEVFNKNEVDRIIIGDNVAVIFLGDIIGPRMNLESNLLISKTINEIVQKRQMSIGIGEIFYPVFVADAVKLITKWLFSFGPYGKKILVLGRATPADVFWNFNQKLVGKIRLIYNPKILARNVPKGLGIEKIDSNLSLSLTETYRWLKNEQTNPPRPHRPKKKISIPKGFKHVIILFFILFVFPFVALLISLSASFIGYKEFLGGSGEGAGSVILLAKSFAVIAEKESKILSYIPGIGLVYKEVTFTAGFIKEADDIALHTIPVVRSGINLFENILGGQIYDPSNQSSKIASGLSFLHDDIVSMRDLTEGASKGNVILAEKVLVKIDFEKYINLTLEGRVIAASLPEILGESGSKTYLVLFENNMELRPTGGFIGSFGLVTFDAGRLSDLTVSDVYSADGQLNGHVEPPAPIKNYLGEANWWLRDSNWDPDFPTSAKRAEWFLDKELGREVDGVAAIDLSPIREILKDTGPMFLSDYNLNITSDNLYEEMQSEAQSNFFPGSHQKASFLTALSQSLLTEVTKLKTNQKLGVLKSFYNGLSQRHIQLYLHDDAPQEAFSVLGWDGAVISPTCGAGCYADLVGAIEANVGVNKANYFIQRNINLDLNIGTYEIDRKMTLNLKNTANPALGLSGKYKAYVRILMPADATLISVKSYTANVQENLSPEVTTVKDHKEVGVLVEVLGGASKSIEFSWNSKLNGNSPLANYGLYIRKQAGTEADPININVALTGAGTYVYNTTLAQDFFSRFSW